MKDKLLNGLRAEGPLYREAAKNMASKPTSAGGKIKDATVAFKESSTTNKLAIISGGMTGITFTLQGLRTIRNSLKRDEKGQRDLGAAAVGAAEVAGGMVMATLFYERMKLNDENLGSRER